MLVISGLVMAVNYLKPFIASLSVRTAVLTCCFNNNGGWRLNRPFVAKAGKFLFKILLLSLKINDCINGGAVLEYLYGQPTLNAGVAGNSLVASNF